MSGKQLINIDVISDIICPFCYIGKRKLEEAMRRMSEKYSFTVRWEPFLLRPNTPEDGTPLPVEAGKIILPPHIVTAAKSVGIDVGGGRSVASVIPNTVKAHTLLEYAKSLETAPGREDVQSEIQERLFHALFVDGLPLTLDEVVAIATDAGLDGEAARAFIQDSTNIEKTKATAKKWVESGVTGVPTFYMNGRFAFSGAQEPEIFIDAFRWAAEKHPNGRLDKPKL
ncbi:uncharacterized protein YwbO-like [Diadema antillarum]|uniref:uncharacterized protein YwbO-like n=1 Tax=Diadema antillarum TaxID=105358 RepID=UPI003A84256F